MNKKIFFKISFVFIMCLLLFAIVLIKKNNDALFCYTDKEFKFKVKFPKDWPYDISDRWEATADFEANPDGGITIYIDNNKHDSIYVFGQRGHISISNESQQFKEEFETNDGVKGKLLYEDYENRKEIYLILGDGFFGAHVNISSECFNDKKQEIMNVLKSIEIIK